MCVAVRRPRFGTVVKGRMVLSEAGEMAADCWRAIPTHFPHATIDAWVIMPDHVHGIIEIGGKGTACRAPIALWQRNYYEIIIRDETALQNIRWYIQQNPQNYDVVMNCGEPRALGNRALLDGPKLGFLASRGETEAHGLLPLKAGEAIISGFLSPMERAVFKEGLAQGRPLIWVKPWALEDGIDTPTIRRALDDGRLLILSPFDPTLDAPSARRAAWCNEYVMYHCQKLILGHLKPGGMLECLLSDAPTDLEVCGLE